MNLNALAYNPTPRAAPGELQMRYLQLQGMQRNALMQQMQMQQAQEQQAAQRAQANALMQLRESIPSPQMAASQTALAGGGGPTLANAAKMPAVDPRLQALHPVMRAGGMSPIDYLKELHPEQKLQAVGMDQNIVDMNRGGKVVTPGTPKPEADKTPAAVREYQFAVGQGYKGTFEQWDTSLKKAGATTIPIHLGQKGLDNTLKLRGDFRSEPVYKAHQEMQSAYSQIQQALKQQTPAGDLAGATKIMKLLDPGSVVRESELGMAMAASGLMDRVTNYANMIKTGQKLTPQQRIDFQALADALYSESVKQYNTKRREYEGIANRNSLPVADVVGVESAQPIPKMAPGSVIKFDANGNMVP